MMEAGVDRKFFWAATAQMIGKAWRWDGALDDGGISQIIFFWHQKPSDVFVWAVDQAHDVVDGNGVRFTGDEFWDLVGEYRWDESYVDKSFS